jgi:hypothetical protein
MDFDNFRAGIEAIMHEADLDQAQETESMSLAKSGLSLSLSLSLSLFLSLSLSLSLSNQPLPGKHNGKADSSNTEHTTRIWVNAERYNLNGKH